MATNGEERVSTKRAESLGDLFFRARDPKDYDNEFLE